MNMLRGEGVNVILYMRLCLYMKRNLQAIINAIDKTQVDYIFKSDKRIFVSKPCTRIYMGQHNAVT